MRVIAFVLCVRARRGRWKLTFVRCTSESHRVAMDGHRRSRRQRSGRTDRAIRAIRSLRPEMTPGITTVASSARRCLIVDDEAPLRALLRRLMEADGFVCVEASAGDEALARLEAGPVPLVLTDF